MAHGHTDIPDGSSGVNLRELIAQTLSTTRPTVRMQTVQDRRAEVRRRRDRLQGAQVPEMEGAPTSSESFLESALIPSGTGDRSPLPTAPSWLSLPEGPRSSEQQALFSETQRDGPSLDVIAPHPATSIHLERDIADVSELLEVDGSGHASRIRSRRMRAIMRRMPPRHPTSAALVATDMTASRGIDRLPLLDVSMSSPSPRRHNDTHSWGTNGSLDPMWIDAMLPPSWDSPPTELPGEWSLAASILMARRQLGEAGDGDPPPHSTSVPMDSIPGGVMHRYATLSNRLLRTVPHVTLHDYVRDTNRVASAGRVARRQRAPGANWNGVFVPSARVAELAQLLGMHQNSNGDYTPAEEPQAPAEPTATQQVCSNNCMQQC